MSNPFNIQQVAVNGAGTLGRGMLVSLPGTHRFANAGEAGK